MTPGMRRNCRNHRTHQLAATLGAVSGAVAIVVSLALVGCASPQGPQHGATGSTNAGTDGRLTYAGSAVSDLDRRPDPALAEVERQYLIGPTAARELGYRIDWQNTGNYEGAKIFDIQNDSVFLLDRRNILTRLDRERGTRIWGLPVAEPIQEIPGLNYVPDNERVYLVAGGGLIVLDAANGSTVGRQRLQRVANTSAVRWGQFLLYGSRNGQMIWHSFPIAYQWRGYQVSHTIEVPPVPAGDHVIAVGSDGRVMALHAPTATMRWDKRLLAPVVAPPAVADGAVYVAGLDQHIWAYDLATGRNMWRYLTESPLTNPPKVVGDKLYQQIPGEGIVAFVARPVDRPGGEVVWTNSGVRGNVIGGRNNRIFVWDAERRRMTILDERSGGVISTIDLPAVREIRVIGDRADEICAFGDGGRIIRLLAR